MLLKIKNSGDMIMFLHHLSESGYFFNVKLNDCGKEVIINVLEQDKSILAENIREEN